MARVAFAWEMGGNFGHLSGFAPLASELAARGHELVAIVQDPHTARHFFAQHVKVLQAPLVRKFGASKDQAQPVTYADLIRPLGFNDPKELASLLHVWRSTLELVQPDLVLYDAAPTALVASRGFGFLKVTTGSTFGIPPSTRPLPLLSKHLRVPFPEHERREQEVVKVINAALQELELERIEALREALDADRHFISGYPELDHYGVGSREKGEWIGASYSLDSGVEVTWPAGDGPKIFLYWRLPARLIGLLQQLVPHGYRVIAAVPNLVRPIEAFSPNVRVVSAPVKLRSLVKSADLAVCHSAVGTGAAFLLAGVPVLLVPTQLEQALVGMRVEEQGLGLCVRDTPTTDYVAPVRRLLSEPSFRDKARAFAQKYGEPFEARNERLVDRIEQLLAERRSTAAAP